MRVLIQRVSQAKVIINRETERTIGWGLLIFVGIESADNEDDIDWLVKKILGLRIFDDSNGVMNLSVEDIGGSILCISQFTLHASTKKGNRPSYIRAANPAIAKPLYEKFLVKLKASTTLKVESGEFGADMQVHLVNEGPVTIWMDSKNKE
ncbi:MAG TPA: D-aminoacyl-tRNA deacylase [Bacteroidales bacterium]|nr:D-aminoacyl-tRNA deacylase [Bacteroidales bacterium]HPO65179.1 D-aminoacyl-tRNA deacylase [Bacteroidales bacterium]